MIGLTVQGCADVEIRHFLYSELLQPVYCDCSWIIKPQEYAGPCMVGN